MRWWLLVAVLLLAGCAPKPAERTMQAPAVDPAATAADSEVDRYCRVCFVNGGHKMSGKPELSVTHGGKKYVFCSEVCKESFEADPVRFALPASDD